MGFLSKIGLGFIEDALQWVLGIEEPDAPSTVVNKQSNIEPLPVIYGERKVGGTRVFVSTGGSKNKYLYIALALCEGEVEEIGDVYINDVLSTDDKFSGKFTVEKYTGNDDQNATTLFNDADTSWTSAHRLRGVAYLAMRFTYDQDVYSGIPEVKVIVRGRKVYDPRQDSTSSYYDAGIGVSTQRQDDPTTWKWSSNNAICLRDYLTNARFGKALPTSAINDASFMQAADDCDDIVTSYASGPYISLFSCNGIFATDETVFDNVKRFLANMRGIMSYSYGQYKLAIDKPQSSTFDLTPDNILSDISIASNSKNKKYNKVTAKFTNPNANWQDDVAVWPPAGSSEETQFLAADNNQELAHEFTLHNTTNYYAARDLARIVCLASRNAGLTIELTATSEAFAIAAGDVVRIEQPSLGWTDAARKLARVSSVQLNDNGEVDLVLQEYSASIYTWDVGSEQPLSPQTTLPDPFTIGAPTNIQITETTTIAADGTLLPSLRIEWDAPTDAFVTHYEIQFQRGTDLETYGLVSDATTSTEQWGLLTDTNPDQIEYGSIGDVLTVAEPNYNSYMSSTTQFVINGVETSSNYNIRVRSVNSLGVRSSWVTTTGIAQGDLDPPGIPDGLLASSGLKQIALSWVAPTETDYSHVEVYENTVNNSATATKIAIATGESYIRSGLNYNVTRYYWVRSVDYSGNTSDLSSVAFATTEFVDTDAFSDAVNNLFSEAGAYGIEPVSSLPASGDFIGQIKYDTTANALYRWDGSAWTDDIFSIESGSVNLASFASGVEPISIVDTLPSPVGYTGANIVFLTTDKKLYRYDSTVPEFTALINAADIDGALALDNFPSDVRPIENVSSLPTSGNFAGRVVFLSTDQKIYRHNGTDWTAEVPATDLSGQIVNTQIANDAINEVKIATAAITSVKLSDNAVTGVKIADSAITGVKISDGAVAAAKIADNAISENKLANNAVTTVKISDNAISAGKIDTNAVTADKVSANAITAVKIAANAVTAAKIDAAAVTADKIEANAVTTDKIAANAITTAKIDAGAITATEIATDAITSVKIEASAITAGKIATDAITSDKIAANAIVAGKIAADAVTADKIAANAVNADKIAANTITASEIAAGAITSDTIAASAITSDKITAGAITTSLIAADAITATEIATDAVTADAILANTIGTSELAADSVTAGIIAAGAVSTSELAATAVTAEKIATDAITADKILAGAIQTDKIAANAITGGLIAASGVITSAAQIDDAVITNAKIENGAITAAKIGTAAITSAKIGDLEVGTIKIANNAVTIPTSAFTSASKTINTSETTVQSLTFTSTGAPVQINFVCGCSIAYSFGGAPSVTFYLYRGDTLVETFTGSAGAQNFTTTVAIAYLDTDTTTGSRTYTVKAVRSGGLGTTVNRRSLTTLEVKK